MKIVKMSNTLDELALNICDFLKKIYDNINHEHAYDILKEYFMKLKEMYNDATLPNFSEFFLDNCEFFEGTYAFKRSCATCNAHDYCAMRKTFIELLYRITRMLQQGVVKCLI